MKLHPIANSVDFIPPQQFFVDRKLSTTPNAIRQRQKRLQDDEFSARLAASSKRKNGARRNREILIRSTMYHNGRNQSVATRKQIAFHLSRGRDAADIVARENIPASVALSIIQSIQSEQ